MNAREAERRAEWARIVRDTAGLGRALRETEALVKAQSQAVESFRYLDPQLASMTAQVVASNQHHIAAISAAGPHALATLHARWPDVVSLAGLGIPHSMLDGLQRQAQLWDRETLARLAVLGDAGRQFQAAHVISQMSVASLLLRARELNLTSTHPLLSKRLAQPYLAYDRFLSRAASELGRAEDEREAEVLCASLRLLDHHALATSETLQAALVVPLDEDAPIAGVRYGLSAAVRRDLASREDVDAGMDVRELMDRSPSARIAATARRVVDQVRACNEEGRYRGRPDDIFKLTNRLLGSCNDLPCRTAETGDAFGNVVDSLYFMLYEAAGGDNLRYLAYVSPESAEAVWAIKHLRNYYFRHDIEHGGERKAAKARSDLRESLEWLGLSRLPRTREDFQLLHLRLLEEVVRFLEELLGRIS